MKQKISIKVLAEIAIFAAIAFALDYIQGAFSGGVFINGGSIGIAMLPILIIAYRRGIVPGVVCGLIVSVLQLLGGSIYIMNGLQFILDYIVTYPLVGVAGAFAGLYKNSKNIKMQLVWILVGSAIGCALKFLSQFAAGYFWLAEGELWGLDTNTMLYSFVYNIAYGGPNLVLCTGLMVLIGKFYPQLINSAFVKEETTEEVKEEE